MRNKAGWSHLFLAFPLSFRYNAGMKILLVTLHAKYVHASLALPSLAAACRDLPGVEIAIGEYSMNEPERHLLRRIVDAEAEILAFSCYIWNMEQTLRIASDVKLLRPETVILLGGPEVSHGAFELLERHRTVDGIIRGEGEATFRELVSLLAEQGTVNGLQLMEEVAGVTCRSGEDIVASPPREPLPHLDAIPSPFAAGLVDLTKPLVYLETSRGCPFSCAFCMSSLEKGVRSFSMERIKSDLLLLMAAGVGTIKLVDRTFNYDAQRAAAIWEFILRENRGSTFHFEIAADLITDEQIELLARVPAGMFRFEIGVQSADPATLKLVNRRSDLERVYRQVERLRRETDVTLHLDLVAGLPLENFNGFLASLEPLFALAPHHIQVEPLKVMKGTPMRQIAAREGYIYPPTPPYKILRTPWLTFHEIQRIELMSRLLDLIYNSNRFATFLARIGDSTPLPRFFSSLALFWEENCLPETLPLHELFAYLRRFCRSADAGSNRDRALEALRYDFCMSEYPASRMAELFPEATVKSDLPVKGVIGKIIAEMSLPPGHKVRTHLACFSHDCRIGATSSAPVELLFLYISAPGRGQQIRCVDLT